MIDNPSASPHDVVRAGYDAMADDYLAWAARIDDGARRQFTAALLERLEPGATIVDLGCGAGVPSTVELARQHKVVGVDISAVQLERARRNLPSATLLHADIAKYDRPSESCDAVTAFYSLTHVPRAAHAAVLARAHRWLRPGGWLLLTLSALGNDDGVQGDFVGVPMFFSGFDADTNRRLVDAAGFTRVRDEVVTLHEPEGDATFLWVLAQR